MRIALVQMDLAWEDVPENHRRAALLLEEAAAGGARLALLPEMFSTGFSMNVSTISDSATQSDQKFLSRLSRDHGIFITAGLVARV